MGTPGQSQTPDPEYGQEDTPRITNGVASSEDDHSDAEDFQDDHQEVVNIIDEILSSVDHQSPAQGSVATSKSPWLNFRHEKVIHG